MEMQYKQYIAKAEIDDNERTVTAFISTSSVDRDGEVLLPKGADFEPFLKNPVVLWAHSYDQTPIGKAIQLKKSFKKITAKIKFAETEFAEEVYQLFKGGFLSAFSVGFIPKESHSPTPDEIKKRPEWAEAFIIFDKWELLEFSAVPVPANSEALATAVKSKSVKLSDELKEELGIDVEVFTPNTDNTKIIVKDRDDSDSSSADNDGDLDDNPNTKDDDDAPIKVEATRIKTSPVIISVNQVILKARPIRVRRIINIKQLVDTQIKVSKGIIW